MSQCDRYKHIRLENRVTDPSLQTPRSPPRNAYDTKAMLIDLGIIAGTGVLSAICTEVFQRVAVPFDYHVAIRASVDVLAGVAGIRWAYNELTFR
jgi:hypothetical protein